MAAPDSSVTVPERLPPTTCEYVGKEKNRQVISTVVSIQPTTTDLVRVIMTLTILFSLRNIPPPSNSAEECEIACLLARARKLLEPRATRCHDEELCEG